MRLQKFGLKTLMGILRAQAFKLLLIILERETGINNNSCYVSVGLRVPKNLLCSHFSLWQPLQETFRNSEKTWLMLPTVPPTVRDRKRRNCAVLCEGFRLRDSKNLINQGLRKCWIITWICFPGNVKFFWTLLWCRRACCCGHDIELVTRLFFHLSVYAYVPCVVMLLVILHGLTGCRRSPASQKVGRRSWSNWLTDLDPATDWHRHFYC